MATASAVLFDLDGTLADTSEDLATGVNLVRADCGLAPLSTPIVVSYIGNGLRALMRLALSDNPGGASLDDACEAMRRHYAAHLLDTTCVYPGTEEMLQQVSDKGYRLAVVTNKPEAPATEICTALGLDRWITVVMGADSCPRKKPDPLPLLRTLKRLGAGTAGSWMIGDNDTDLESGRRAGLQRCYCTFGYGDPRDETWDLCIDSLTELAPGLPPVPS